MVNYGDKVRQGEREKYYENTEYLQDLWNFSKYENATDVIAKINEEYTNGIGRHSNSIKGQTGSRLNPDTW